MALKVLSWNVNGIRSAIRKGFCDSITLQDPDIVCLQEVKATPSQVELALPVYEAYWFNSEKAGYAGVATLCKTKPRDVIQGLGHMHHDHVGRALTLEFDEYYVVNLYSPNSQRGLTRLEYRTQQWEPDLREFLGKLDRKKPVIFCGDFNVAHEEIDLKNPKANRRNAGFTDEERSEFGKLLASGFLDTFREIEKGPGHYTWWTYRHDARARNIGWRLDYICISQRLRPHLKAAQIHAEVHGSDHCPVSVILN